MKIATQHYQDSVITPYGNNHWNGKEKIDISKEKDDAVILEISAKGKRAIQLKEKNEFEQNIVQVDKSADNIRPLSGETVEYTLTVTNVGDSTASAVQVTDQLPAGVSYIGDDEPNGNYDPVTGIWNVGAVNAGEQKILKIIVLVNCRCFSWIFIRF